VATYYEDEVDQAVKNISAIIEPALIIVLGLAVLLIVIAVLYPIYSLVFSININNASSSGAGTNF
jgi:type IV pilus assembly protein PilC